jgi:hypothetical protein
MPDTGVGPKRDGGDTARYIEHLAKELRTLAAQSDLGFLAYLLGMVEDEAGTTARRLDERGDKPDS